MPRRASAKRYAQAVFKIALERNQLDHWAEDLSLISETLRNEEFRLFLDNAKVPLLRKVKAIEEVLHGTNPLAQNLLSLLVARGLVELAPQVEKEYLSLLDAYRGRELVEVYSAVALESQEKEHITRFLTKLINKEVVLDTRVNPSVLGGLVLKVGDKLIDGSTRTRLEALRKALTDTSR